MIIFRARASALAIVPKCKVAVVFLQTVGLLPVVFGVRLPDAYHNWMSFLDAFQVAEWSNLVIPDSCLSGGFRGRLVIDALAPFALMLALA
eukprot:2428059-Prymnesium_polylepis.1